MEFARQNSNQSGQWWELKTPVTGVEIALCEALRQSMTAKLDLVYLSYTINNDITSKLIAVPEPTERIMWSENTHGKRIHPYMFLWYKFERLEDLLKIAQFNDLEASTETYGMRLSVADGPLRSRCWQHKMKIYTSAVFWSIVNLRAQPR
jgi:hypothetical protein